MVIERYPIAFQQIYKFSKYFFSEKKFLISIILSKTPYLSASIASLGAKLDNKDILKLGKCFLIPKLDGSDKWQHIVIERAELINSQKIYYYKFRKPKNRKSKSKVEENDVGLKAKPAQFFIDYAIVNHYANEAEWLGKHDVFLSNSNDFCNNSSVFPYVIGNKSKFIDWFNKDLNLPLNDGKSLADLSGNNIDGTQYSDINFLSPYKLKDLESPTIWIDKVPPATFHGKALIFLSPYLSNFEDKMLQVGDLYQEQKLFYSTIDCLPVELSTLLSEHRCYNISLFSKENI